MTDKPIIFSAPMVRALLEGRKTQTRMIYNVPAGSYVEQGRVWAMTDGCAYGDAALPYAPGDRLYVREAWAAHHEYDQCKPMGIPSHEDIWLVADGPVEPAWTGRWRSSIHMPRRASRLTLTVTEVRVERLQDISAADSIAEGVQCATCEAMKASACHGRGCFASIDAYRTLWNSLHGPDAWDANPWVVALTFTVHKGNIDQVKS